MILRAAAGSTVAAMEAAGVRRLVVVSAAVLFDDLGVAGTVLRRTLLRNVGDDSLEMERIVVASALDWTIARPPRLTNGPLNGPLRRGGRALARSKRLCGDQPRRRR